MAKIGQESEYLAPVDADFVNFIKTKDTFFLSSIPIQNIFYEYRFHRTTNEIRRLYFEFEKSKIEKLHTMKTNTELAQELKVDPKVYEQIRELFSIIEPMTIATKTIDNGIGADIVFEDKQTGIKKSPQEVATYSLSVMPLNVYLEVLKLWLEGAAEKGFLFKANKFPTTILYDEPEISLSPIHIVKLFDLLFALYEKLRERNIPSSFALISHSSDVLEVLTNKTVSLHNNEKIVDYYNIIKLQKDSNGSYIGKQFPLRDGGAYKENPYLEADKRQHQIAMDRRQVVRERKKSKPKVDLFFKI